MTKLALCTSGGGGGGQNCPFSEVEVVGCVNTEDDEPQQQHPVGIVKTLTEGAKRAGCTYSSSSLTCTLSCWWLFPHFRGCSHTHTHARTHTRTHSLSLTHTHARTHTRTHSLSLTHTHTHAHTHTHTPSLHFSSGHKSLNCCTVSSSFKKQKQKTRWLVSGRCMTQKYQVVTSTVSLERVPVPDGTQSERCRHNNSGK